MIGVKMTLRKDREQQEGSQQRLIRLVDRFFLFVVFLTIVLTGLAVAGCAEMSEVYQGVVCEECARTSERPRPTTDPSSLSPMEKLFRIQGSSQKSICEDSFNSCGGSMLVEVAPMTGANIRRSGSWSSKIVGPLTTTSIQHTLSQSHGSVYSGPESLQASGLATPINRKSYH